MLFIKGDFVTVPNKGALEGLPAIVQSVFMSICRYANNDGACYPSIETLSVKAGCGRRSVIDAIATLCEKGLLSKDSRQKENKTNLYHINIVHVNTKVQEVHQGECATCTTPSAPGDHRTISSLTKSNELSSADEKEVSVPVAVPSFEVWMEGQGFRTIPGTVETAEGVYPDVWGDEEGVKLPLARLRGLRNAYKRIQPAPPSPINPINDYTGKLVDLISNDLKKQYGSAPIFGRDDKIILASLIKRTSWDFVRKYGKWFFRNEKIDKKFKYGVKAFASNDFINRFIADTGISFK